MNKNNINNNNSKMLPNVFIIFKKQDLIHLKYSYIQLKTVHILKYSRKAKIEI